MWDAFNSIRINLALSEILLLSQSLCFSQPLLELPATALLLDAPKNRRSSRSQPSCCSWVISFSYLSLLFHSYLHQTTSTFWPIFRPPLAGFRQNKSIKNTPHQFSSKSPSQYQVWITSEKSTTTIRDLTHWLDLCFVSFRRLPMLLLPWEASATVAIRLRPLSYGFSSPFVLIWPKWLVM